MALCTWHFATPINLKEAQKFLGGGAQENITVALGRRREAERPRMLL